jgi:hypothetical protein
MPDVCGSARRCEAIGWGDDERRREGVGGEGKEDKVMAKVRAQSSASECARRKSGLGTSSLVSVTSIVHVPDDLAHRPAAKAERRHMSVDELAVELVTSGLGAVEDDALEAFIASGDSGDPTWASRDTHVLRSETTARRAGETA